MNPFVDAHFKFIGERHPTTRKYSVQCLYCPPGSPLIIHRENRCADHIGNQKCKGDIPENIILDAKRILMGKSCSAAPVAGAELAASSTLRAYSLRTFIYITV